MAKSFELQIQNILDSKSTNNKRYHDSKKIDMQRQLFLEAEAVRAWIQRFIALYYESYTPSRYERTYAFRNSLESVQIKDNQAFIRFDPQMARHNSLFKNGDGYVPSLINYGWRWKKAGTNIPRFTFYDGDRFLEDAISAYLSSTTFDMQIEVYGRDGNCNIYNKTHLPQK
ncbi:MAG: hypothetical protein RR370_01880 [Synergistaceae bacterium]